MLLRQGNFVHVFNLSPLAMVCSQLKGTKRNPASSFNPIKPVISHGNATDEMNLTETDIIVGGNQNEASGTSSSG